MKGPKGHRRPPLATGSGAGRVVQAHELLWHAYGDSYVQLTLFQAKGDLVAGSGAITMEMMGVEYSTPTRVAVGTDGIALIADSTATAGISYTAHGAGSHTDITRSIFVAAAQMSGNAMDAGSLTVLGVAPDKVPVAQLADAATQGFFFNFIMPADAKPSTAISAAIYWAPGSTDASTHAVRWSFDLIVMAVGAGLGATGTTTAFTGVAQANTLNQMVIDTLTQVLSSTSAGDVIRGDLRRIGADAADTYVGAVNVVGVRIDYTATQ